MHERDRHRSLAHGARHPLDRARADVAGDEHSGHARLERERVALKRPAVALDVEAGEDEAALVARDDTLEPVGQRPGADEHEARVGLLDRVAAVGVADAQGAQAAVALRGHGLTPGAHLDVVERLDLLDQVVRHRLRQRVAADEHRHAACV